MLSRLARGVARVMLHDPQVVAAERRLLVLLAVRIAALVGGGAGLAELISHLAG